MNCSRILYLLFNNYQMIRSGSILGEEPALQIMREDI